MREVGIRGLLMRAPWWVLSLVTGTIFGVGMFAFQLVNGRSVAASAVGAAVAGLFFGLIMGPVSRRMNDRFFAAVGELPPAKHPEVRRAVLRGPVPADLEVRRAAIAVISDQIESHRKLRWALFMWLFFIASSLWLAVSDSGWWFLVVLLFTGFFTLHLWTPRHLKKRRLLLSDKTSLSS
ncbi:MAG TPA: hypothetical protein VER55_05790 [Ardenticatenaceae bacterium]|nr:hypothetical protein [Ardenticatenaceae bacterium]